MELTFGEKRVRTVFNPSDDTMVSEIKQKSAELINIVQKLSEDRPGDMGEVRRLVALASTAYEEAAMWAVKAATA